MPNLTEDARLGGTVLRRTVFSEREIQERVRALGEEISRSYAASDRLLLYDPEAPLEDRAVILVEDIVDSGTTLNRLIPRLEARDPRSLQVCALLHKRKARLVREPRWVGFDAPNEFLVGYGLDYGEDFRHLPYIASL
jgi:hypoxanthine-guanine phosphoribosyltransferase